MVDIVCDCLKTKEIFHFDSDRFVSEGQASFLLHGESIFEEERRESNKLPHRRKRLEDIILQYQTNKNGISEEEYSVRLQKIYKAIDDATKNIDTWQTSDKYAYYRMDLRHYKRVIIVEPDGKGNSMCMVMPDFTEDMEELSKESRAVSDYHFQYMDLQLWSDYKFNGNEKFKEYDKYSNISIVLKELEEMWGFLCNYNGKDNSESEDGSFLFHRYLSIIPYTCAVLLRDFEKDLTDRDRNLCRHIIFDLGYLFSEISDYEFGQAGNGVEAVTLGLILLMNGENTKTADNENPLYLLLKLVLRDWSDDSRIMKQIANAIWKQRELSLNDFLKSYQQNIEQVLMEDWNIWGLLKSKMIELGNKELSDYYASSNVPFGEDRVITTYLFANAAWPKNVHRCDLLSEKRAVFLTDFIEKSRSVKAMFYALAKLLNSVGMEPYKDIGIEWIYKLIMKDPECRYSFMTIHYIILRNILEILWLAIE